MPSRITPRSPSTPTTPAPPVTVPPATIREAEKLLKLAGFNPGAIDGRPTPAFDKAVRDFQGAWGLTPSGQVDARTLDKLRSTGKRIRAWKDDLFVSVGQKSGGILNVEKRLRLLGYDAGKVDGIYSRQTAEAVKAFRADQLNLRNGSGALHAGALKVLRQEAKGLQHAPERRRVAPTKAQARLDAATAKATAKRHADGTVGIREGAKSPVVANLQKHLRAAGFSPKHTGGVFDERTAGALKAFQRRSGLPATGVADARTWKALKKSFILTGSKASPAQALGERSGAVKASEALLKKLGFNPGKVDGLFDRRTQQAVKAFEKKHHLTADGKISAQQLAKMKKVAAGGTYRDKVLDTARRFLGFREGPNNANPFSRHFGRGPEPWCADFVSYCYSKAGKPLNEPWTPALLAKLKANGTFNTNRPKAGDIVMFDWHPGSGVSSEHTGLVEKVYRRNGRTYVQTIEGNSGDMVRRNTYTVGDPRLSFGTIR